MRILLDTSYLYNFADAPKRLSSTERRFFSKDHLDLHVSAVSIWEMRLKWSALHRSGDRKSPHDPEDVLLALDDQGVTYLSLSPRHASAPLRHALAHKDPFDELLLVQAQEEGLKLLTVDRQLVDHPLAMTA